MCTGILPMYPHSFIYTSWGVSVRQPDQSILCRFATCKEDLNVRRDEKMIAQKSGVIYNKVLVTSITI